MERIVVHIPCTFFTFLVSKVGNGSACTGVSHGLLCFSTLMKPLNFSRILNRTYNKTYDIMCHCMLSSINDVLSGIFTQRSIICVLE